MLRLVEADVAGAGNLQPGQESPALVGERRDELDAFLLELVHRLFDVLAHQVELVLARLRRGVDGSSAGGSAKISQPSPPSTFGNSRTSRKKARAASASSANTIVCAPAITAQAPSP